MNDLTSAHERHGARFTEHGGLRRVAEYGRPERTHKAVRNGVGVIERACGIIELTGDDRVSFLDNAVSNRVPTEDGTGCYALLLDPQGAIETDLYAYNAGERLLLLVPPERTEPLASQFQENVFIEDVEIRIAGEYAVFGIHGPMATEKIASVLNGAAAPADLLSFVRGTVGEAGVTVISGDGRTGEEGYEVICAVEDAPVLFDTLLNHGMNAVPFGYETWNSLTLEAGTPLFESELRGQIPNIAGIRNALDFEKGCYVGQEVVSRVENRGRPSRRLIGLMLDRVPEPGAAVFSGDSAVGTVTRAARSPIRERPIALSYVDFDLDSNTISVRIDGDDHEATVIPLPFVGGSMDSSRRPSYT